MRVFVDLHCRQDGKALTGFIRLRIGKNGRLLYIR